MLARGDHMEYLIFAIHVQIKIIGLQFLYNIITLDLCHKSMRFSFPSIYVLLGG